MNCASANFLMHFDTTDIVQNFGVGQYTWPCKVTLWSGSMKSYTNITFKCFVGLSVVDLSFHQPCNHTSQMYQKWHSHNKICYYHSLLHWYYCCDWHHCPTMIVTLLWVLTTAGHVLQWPCCYCRAWHQYHQHDHTECTAYDSRPYAIYLLIHKVNKTRFLIALSLSFATWPAKYTSRVIIIIIIVIIIITPMSIALIVLLTTAGLVMI